MIRYHPPKSQVWGHQVGRLSAVSVVERATQFLDDQCIVRPTEPCEFTVLWSSARRLAIGEVLNELDQLLGPLVTQMQFPAPPGQPNTHRTWRYSAEVLPALAAWFDKFEFPLKAEELVAHTSVVWTFAWRDEPPSLRPSESAGGVFGIHLGHPHRLTTMFAFRDLERYRAIKEYLNKLDLIQLSDKHLRPKLGTETTRRRAK